MVTKKQPAQEDGFSRRERAIMDALYSRGKATAAQVQAAIPDAPSNTAIRTLLTILEKKGHVRHTSDGTRFTYEPAVPRDQMGQRATRTLLATFYGNSVEKVVAALLDNEAVGKDELDRLAVLIAKARKEGR